MNEMAGSLLNDIYLREYFNSNKDENSLQSSETLTNEGGNQIRVLNERNVDFKGSKIESGNKGSPFNDYNNHISEDKFGDKSTTLFRNSNDYDTYLPCIESVVTDNDLSDLAHEFAEFGKSFTRDSISIEKEDNDILFSIKKSSTKDFSKKFKIEIDPKTKYTYNNLYNINTEIYSSSPNTSPYRYNNKGINEKFNDERERKNFVNDGERIDLRFIQNALLFDSKKNDKEIYNPNESILKGLNDTNDKRITKTSFMDMNVDFNTFNTFNTTNKHLSAITKIERDNYTINEEEDDNDNADEEEKEKEKIIEKNVNIIANENDNEHDNHNEISLAFKKRVSYQNSRPTYLTNHQPIQPPNLNIYGYNNYMKSIPTSPKSFTFNESKITSNDPYVLTHPNLLLKEESKKIDNNNKTNQVTVNTENSKSSDDIPLASLTERIKPLSTPSLSSSSISVPSTNENTNSTSIFNDKNKRLNVKPFITVTEERDIGLERKMEDVGISYIKHGLKNSIVNDISDRKVSTRMQKKKKRHYFSNCCSSKVLENSFTEESSRSFDRDFYIRCQKEQMHSFEAKRINNSKIYQSSILSPENMKNGNSSLTSDAKRVSFKPYYLSRKGEDDSINNLKSPKSLSSSSSSSNSPSSSSSSSPNSRNSNHQDLKLRSELKLNINECSGHVKESLNESDKSDSRNMPVEDQSLKNLLISGNNDKSPTKSMIILSDQANSQGIQSKKDVIYDNSNITSPEYSYCEPPTSPNSYSVKSPLSPNSYSGNLPSSPNSYSGNLPSSPNSYSGKSPSSPNSYSGKSPLPVAPPVPERRKQQVKYCTSYEKDENGNWKLVERRYNDSKVIKVEIISKKMI